VMRSIEKGIVVVKTAFLCSAHALIIAMCKVHIDPNYASYRPGMV